jgi:hypothetical protein
MLAAREILKRTEGYPGTETLEEGVSPLPGDKVVLLPGNHDRYSERALIPTSAQFENGNIFGGNWSLDAPAHADQQSEVNHKLLTATNGTQLAVVCGDFSYRPPWPKYTRVLGRGEARQETLDEMGAITSDYASRSIAAVWAVHYPPVAKGVKRSLRLERHEEVVRAASRSSIDLIFCGHTHDAKPAVPAFYGDRITGIKVICAGSACEYVRRGVKDRSYFEVELDVRRGRARLIRTPLEMIYSVWPERLQVDGRLGNGAEFCPAP